MRAAQAVELALREVAPDAEVKNVDVLTLTNAAFRKVYGEAYLDLVNKAPHVLGYFYDLMDRPRRSNSTRDKLRLAVEKINLHKLCDELECGDWDVIVNTHFLPASLIASMRRKRSMRTPQMTATTDFETHRLWVSDPCELFTTATEEGRLYLGHWGVDVDKVQVTGIPIHPVFAKDKPRADCLKRQNLSGDRPIVLQLSGGFGVGPVEQLFNAILNVDVPLEIVAVAGKNVKVKEKLAKLDVPDRHRVHILGFTDQIDELMACADLVVSKPGYGIVSECIANDTALLYTSRGHFIEYDLFVAEMPRVVRCRFISQEDLLAGRWAEAISSLLAQPGPPERARVDGALVAAGIILSS